MPVHSEFANAIRALTLDAVQQAASGHIGAPMGMADIMTVLWRGWLKHNPANPKWPNRDRFILSNGHGSMLLYAALHLSGYDLSLAALQSFRQLDSATPGHPEVGQTPGVEGTTGPLGQGFANAVGMAIAESVLAARYNRSGLAIVDHRTWVFLGDGCLMEGISHEAASLAGVLGLGKLIAVYDDNGISIDGEVRGWFADDTPARFRAYNWHVIDTVDGHDPAAIARAFGEACQETDRPTLICAQTTIGFGSPNKAGSADMHGFALDQAEIQATKKALNWQQVPFAVPEDIYAGWDCQAAGAEVETKWQVLWQEYKQAHAERAEMLSCAWSGRLPNTLKVAYQRFMEELLADKSAMATRAASERCLEVIGPLLPNLVGGCADLTDSCRTRWPGCQTISKAMPGGNYLYYGVREFAMTAIGNGICLHGGLQPYTGTFLIFSDYARNAIRMAALMRLPHVFVYTHDSIGVGEDGPTHQPIEQLTGLRATPGLSVWRPCDLVETAVAWQAALANSEGPTALILSRQKLVPQQHAQGSIQDIAKGGYILVQETGPLHCILLATGSEVDISVQAATLLAAESIGVRVVSIPSVDVFEQQELSWQERVLPPQTRCRLAIEAGHPDCWYKLVGLDGGVLGINRFGVSAPGSQIFEAYGFTAQAIAGRVRQLLPSAQATDTRRPTPC